MGNGTHTRLSVPQLTYKLQGFKLTVSNYNFEEKTNDIFSMLVALGMMLKRESYSNNETDVIHFVVLSCAVWYASKGQSSNQRPQSVRFLTFALPTARYHVVF